MYLLTFKAKLDPPIVDMFPFNPAETPKTRKPHMTRTYPILRRFMFPLQYGIIPYAKVKRL
jgi:hypothetical protein